MMGRRRGRLDLDRFPYGLGDAWLVNYKTAKEKTFFWLQVRILKKKTFNVFIMEKGGKHIQINGLHC